MWWPALWWIFPLACVVMMVVMAVFMTGVGGMGCMPRMRRMDPRLDARKSLDAPQDTDSRSGG